MSKLILHSYPILVLPELAQQIGLNEAIFLQQLHYWINKEEAEYRDNKFWVYNSYKKWQEDNFPFWSERTIRRISDNLLNIGLIETTSKYNKMKQDNTLWFTINYKNLKPYEEKAEYIFNQKQEKKKLKKIEKQNKSKKRLELLNSQSGQNDQTIKYSNNQSGQNDQTIWTKRPDHLDKMTVAIQETTTETNIRKKTSSEKNDDDENLPKVKISKENLEYINNYILEFKIRYKATLKQDKIKELFIKKGKDKLDHYLKTYSKFLNVSTKEIGNIAGYFYKTVLEEYPAPVVKEKESFKPAQATNYEQREYDDEFFDSLYVNLEEFK